MRVCVCISMCRHCIEEWTGMAWSPAVDASAKNAATQRQREPSIHTHTETSTEWRGGRPEWTLVKGNKWVQEMSIQSSLKEQLSEKSNAHNVAFHPNRAHHQDKFGS